MPAPMGYIPYWNNAPWQATIVLRTETQPSSIAGALRQAVWDVDAGVPVPAVTTFADVLNAAVAPNRFQTLLVGSFAMCALLLASLGIYGVPASLSRGARRSWGFASRSAPTHARSSAAWFATGWRQWPWDSRSASRAPSRRAV